MTSRSKTILQELNSIAVNRDKHHVLENRVQHLVSSAQNIISQLYEMYDQEHALDLERRLINSVRSGDHSKFSRGIRKVDKSGNRNDS